MLEFQAKLLVFPALLLIVISCFALVLFCWQAKSTAEKGSSTKDHSDRIYKDFEMYLKVNLLLVAALGYIRFEVFAKHQEIARDAMQAVGAISLFVMTLFSIFVICHQGSKIRRWENIEWPKAIFWQESWAVLGMWIFSTSVWVVGNAW